MNTYFMYPDTAKQLLAQSRAFRAEKQEARAKREAAEAIQKAIGWSDSQAAELGAIFVELNKGKP